MTGGGLQEVDDGVGEKDGEGGGVNVGVDGEADDNEGVTVLELEGDESVDV
jgi:hypothetical protein